jgi:hypothetical protein
MRFSFCFGTKYARYSCPLCQFAREKVLLKFIDERVKRLGHVSVKLWGGTERLQYVRNQVRIG